MAARHSSTYTGGWLAPDRSQGLGYTWAGDALGDFELASVLQKAANSRPEKGTRLALGTLGIGGSSL